MRRETKAGLVMSLSFVGLVGVVVASKYREQTKSPAAVRDDAELAALASTLEEPKPAETVAAEASAPPTTLPETAEPTPAEGQPVASVPRAHEPEEGVFEVARGPRVEAEPTSRPTSPPEPEPTTSTPPPPQPEPPPEQNWTRAPATAPREVAPGRVQERPWQAPTPVQHQEPEPVVARGPAPAPAMLPETAEPEPQPAPVERSPAAPSEPVPTPAPVAAPVEPPAPAPVTTPSEPAPVPIARVPEPALRPVEPAPFVPPSDTGDPARLVPPSNPLPLPTPPPPERAPGSIEPPPPPQGHTPRPINTVIEPTQPTPIVRPVVPVPDDGIPNAAGNPTPTPIARPTPTPVRAEEPLPESRVREPAAPGTSGPPPFPAGLDPYRVVPEGAENTRPGANLLRPIVTGNPGLVGGTMPNRPGVMAPAGDDAPEHPTALAQGMPPPVGAAPTTGTPPISVPATPVSRNQVEAFDELTYRAQTGDNFALLSTRFYQSDRYKQALLMYNRDHPRGESSYRQEPPVLQPGQPVYVPPVRILEKQYPQAIAGLQPLPPNPVQNNVPPPYPPPGANPPPPYPPPGGNPPPPQGVVPPAGARPPAGTPPIGLAPPQNLGTVNPPVVPPSNPPGQNWAQPTGEKQYRVDPRGEWFRDIAQRLLGNRERWAEIYKMNTRFNPQYPVPGGSILRVPADARVP